MYMDFFHADSLFILVIFNKNKNVFRQILAYMQYFTCMMLAHLTVSLFNNISSQSEKSNEDPVHD